jgi:hypothetical protein
MAVLYKPVTGPFRQPGESRTHYRFKIQLNNISSSLSADSNSFIIFKRIV